MNNFGVDELVIALPTDRRAQLSRALTRGFSRYVRVKYAADFGDLLPRRFEVRRIGTAHYIDFAPVARVSWAKRVVDLTVAALGLVVLAPLFLAVAVAIKLDSPGPTFYSQVRVGKDSRRFRMLKFRSMRQDADALVAELSPRNEVSGPMFKIRRDPRVTRVGKFLRRTSLDELPQLVNVLLGHMSFIGPRPERPFFVESLSRDIPYYAERHRVRPGITGWAQVNYPYGASIEDAKEKLSYDFYYIKNYSLLLDLLVLLQTVQVVFWPTDAVPGGVKCGVGRRRCA